ncbi:DUF418 domain-containing protein [Rhizohabitans arisaemae]|uniref:DUF418 domain-containing protein n=1 Tax=Rhizohabitans arisaemae TaxID=2720610 RepID=UPI0024B20B72|nr:DUF418 domain-containing protein [Rhizohabitans arisaemae]
MSEPIRQAEADPVAGRTSRRRVARGGVLPAERSLAPDLARGLMLLLIVLSNTGFHLWAAKLGPSGWHAVDGSTADRVVQFLMIVVLDLRIYPLFAFLFGYGMMQLYRRQTEAGTSEKGAVALLRRRSLWLIVVGFAHAALLMAGDIIGFYGLLSLIFGWLFLRRGNRVLLIAAGAVLTLQVLSGLPSILELAGGNVAEVGTAAGDTGRVAYASGEENALTAAGTRMATWVFVAIVSPLPAFTAQAVLLLGFWAARRRILEEPGSHLPLLRRTAVLGIAVGWLGGLPQALAHIGVLDVPAGAVALDGPFAAIQATTGVAGGLGYVALITLIAHRMSERVRRSRPVVAVAAVGKRSLSSYLAHSLIFSPVLAAWGFGLGGKLTSASMALFAVGVWLVTVAAAYALERAGRRGPAETVLRRLVYRSADRSQPERAGPVDGSSASGRSVH